MKKNDVHVFQGMSRDVHPKKQQQQFFWDAMNVRLTAINEDTLLTVTNEIGPLRCISDDYEQVVIEGKYLGHTTIGNDCIVFSVKDEWSYITKIEFIESSSPDPQQLHKNNLIMKHTLVKSDQLGFDADCPIEAIGVYGSTNVSKVYWTDGKNQPRIMRVGINDYNGKEINAHTFDFTPTLQLYEEVTITRNPVGGMFPAGVIQYAFTYYNKYAQETNVFYTTPLQYTSFEDRGGSPEDKVSNSFTINITNVDPNFDYLRVYSILRTTRDAEAIVTKVMDVKITKQGNKIFADDITITDTGTKGEIVDPSYLYYVGGESIHADTMTHKNNILFLGNIQLERHDPFQNSLEEGACEITREYDEHHIKYDNDLSELNQDIVWYNTLVNGYCAGFKTNEYYKLGVQFQHVTGKWSRPIYIDTKQEEFYPHYTNVEGKNEISLFVPSFKCKIPSKLWQLALDNNYVKARGIVVFPNLYNRYVVAQGILNGTVYNDADREHSLPYAQSSWFFRPFNIVFEKYSTDTHVNVEYRNGVKLGRLPHRFGEIQGAEVVDLANPDREQRIEFKVDLNLVTFHSPDVEMDESFYNFDYSPFYDLYNVGLVEWYKSYSDIDIQTETAKLDAKGGGFLKGMKSESNGDIMCSGLFYSDYLVSFVDNDFKTQTGQKNPVLFMVSPWNSIGSLNNDINRPIDKGTRSALLQTKKLSNLRIGSTLYREVRAYSTKVEDPIYYYWEDNSERPWWDVKTTIANDADAVQETQISMKFFNVDYVGMCKVKGNKGYYGNVDTLLNPATDYGKYFSNNSQVANDITQYGKPTFSAPLNTFHSTLSLRGYSGTSYTYSFLGDKASLYQTQDAIRMKYKSTPHFVIDLKDRYLIERYDASLDRYENESHKNVQLLADILNKEASFKGEGYNHQDIWYPAGDAIDLRVVMYADLPELRWTRGDTWYQRYDCMKTYAYTLEDQNSVIEIGSFPVETRINIDGRYDTNRGQYSNIVAMPTNFNLINKVYSQHDNFFSYTVLDPELYSNVSFNNQITWTLGHQATADVDEWSRITLASIYEMDGTKGPITRLYTFNDQVICFQHDAISQILYDERVALSASDGNPIELSNSSSFQGTRYFSDSIGCINKWSICNSPSALYFLDTRQNNLYALTGEGIQPISKQKGFGYYFSSDAHSQKWKCHYDAKYNDLYILGDSDCLVYSEQLGAFTSFMSYNNTSTFFNIGSELYAIKSVDGIDESIWRMFYGDYNNFFGEYQPFYFTFISNDEPLSGKFFTNIQVNADLYQDGVILNDRLFDYISISDEYQSANNVALDFRLCKPSSLKKKFRLWNINIPRHGKDRIANTWCKIQLGVRGTTEAEKNALKNLKFVMHDLNVTYYI